MTLSLCRQPQPGDASRHPPSDRNQPVSLPQLWNLGPEWVCPLAHSQFSAQEGTVLGPKGPLLVQIPQVVSRQEASREGGPCSDPVGPTFVLGEGQANGFQHLYQAGSTSGHFLLPGTSMCLSQILASWPPPSGSLSPSPHQPLPLLCLGHFCPCLVQTATPPAWTSSLASAEVCLPPLLALCSLLRTAHGRGPATQQTPFVAPHCQGDIQTPRSSHTSPT